MSQVILAFYLLAAVALVASIDTEKFDSGNTTMTANHVPLAVPMEISNSCQTTKNLTFSPCSNGLPWPIEDFSSISVLITHGIHCVDIVQHNDSSEYHLFHQEHCLGLMLEIDRFFKENPGYSIPNEMCRDFRQIAFPGGRIRRGNWWGWRNQNGKKKREAVQQGVITQEEIGFKVMATRNFELLLLKEKRGSKLSKSEKMYLEGSRSPLMIKMSALGIFCKYEGYVGVVKDVINRKPVF